MCRTLLATVALFSILLSGCGQKAPTSEPQNMQADAAPAPAPVEASTPPADAPPTANAPAPQAIAAELKLQDDQGCPAGKKAGDSWKHECNTCTCTSEGKVACTLKACMNLEIEDAKDPKSAVCSNGKKAGESWEHDCNTCTCTDDGEIACTLKACG